MRKTYLSIPVPLRYAINLALFAAFLLAANGMIVSGAISKAASAVIPCAGHTFLVGEAVHILGCLGMVEINGLRGNITAISAGVNITVSINSTAFGTWTSGGTLNTRPQTGESVTAGCEFDLPCRFNSRIDVAHVAAEVREAGSIDIIELVAP